MKKVLVVEDNRFYSDMIFSNFGSKVLVMKAFTIKEAENIFQENPDIDVILMDACVPGDTPNTMGLVSKIRETFKGPIITISSDSSYSKKLIEAGCNYESNKYEAAQDAFEIMSKSKD